MANKSNKDRMKKFDDVAKVALDRGDYASAANTYKQAFKQDPYNGYWIAQQSLCLLKLKKTEDALSAANSAIHLNHSSGHLRRAEVCEEISAFDEALRSYMDYHTHCDEHEADIIFAKAAICMDNQEKIYSDILGIMSNPGADTKCALCFRSFSEHDDLRTTKSHSVPHSGYKACSLKKLYCPGTNTSISASKLTSKVFTFCQPEIGVKSIKNCEVTVLQKSEASFVEFLQMCILNGVSGADATVDYDNHLYRGIASVAYRTMLDNGNSGLLPDSFKRLILSCRAVTLGVQCGIKLFVFFPAPAKFRLTYDSQFDHGYEQFMKILDGRFTSFFPSEASWMLSLNGVLVLVTLDDCAFSTYDWPLTILCGGGTLNVSSNLNRDTPVYVNEYINFMVNLTLQAMSQRPNNTIDTSEAPVENEAGLEIIVLPTSVTKDNFLLSTSPFALDSEGFTSFGNFYIMKQRNDISRYLLVITWVMIDRIISCVGIFVSRRKSGDFLYEFSNNSIINFTAADGSAYELDYFLKMQGKKGDVVQTLGDWLHATVV